jgi:pimeloyl-ACP methyl ester carboxylesterase
MSQFNIQFLSVGKNQCDSVHIAYLNTPAKHSEEPGLVWLPGLKSTMVSVKVNAVHKWAVQTNRSIVRFDYSGHGASDGEFTDGTIGQWLEESLAILREVACGPQILVGSSMGGWLVLLILRAIANEEWMVQGLCPIEGAVLIAPAWDMTEELMWNQFSDEAREAIEMQGFFERPSRYGDGPYTISKQLIEEGRSHLIGDDSFTPPCPVRIIHGIEDPDVPWRHANKLMQTLQGDNIMLSLVQDGGHRLSRSEDVDKIIYTINDLYESIAEEQQEPHFI